MNTIFLSTLLYGRRAHHVATYIPTLSHTHRRYTDELSHENSHKLTNLIKTGWAVSAATFHQPNRTLTPTTLAFIERYDAEIN